MTATITLRTAFEAELARRDAETRARLEAERQRQEADHAKAVRLHDILAADPEFLAAKKLTLELTRYTVVLEHPDFDYRVAPTDRAHIPAEGRVVIVANHPLGGLDALGLEEGMVRAVAEKAALASSMKGNPVVLDRTELEAILRRAMRSGA